MLISFISETNIHNVRICCINPSACGVFIIWGPLTKNLCKVSSIMASTNPLSINPLKPKDVPKSQNKEQKCRQQLEYSVVNDTRVHKLVDAIEALGCPIPKNFFSCRSCDEAVSGGFCVPQGNPKIPYEPKILMCDTEMDAVTFQNTVVHELVHAYDNCKMKIKHENCLQHACTEIRAASLSGECNYWQEFQRGNRNIAAGGKECVQRRARMSLESNPHCKDVAMDAVLASWDFCSKQKEPLGEWPK